MGRVKELSSDEELIKWSMEYPEMEYMPNEPLYMVVKTLALDEDNGLTCSVFGDNIQIGKARAMMNDLYAGRYPDFFSSVDVWSGSDIEIIPIVY